MDKAYEYRKDSKRALVDEEEWGLCTTGQFVDCRGKDKVNNLGSLQVETCRAGRKRTIKTHFVQECHDDI